MQLTTDEEMHCRLPLWPRRMNLRVITANNLVAACAAAAMEERPQLLRLLLAERRRGADPEQRVQEEGYLQRRVALWLRRGFVKGT